MHPAAALATPTPDRSRATTEARHAELVDAVAHLRAQCHRAARARVAVEAAAERCAVARTIPRGSGPDDADPAPAVDVDVWGLHVRYHRRPDPETLGALAAEYDRYAVSLAVRLHREHEALDDLRQVAREGLIGALQRFDPERRTPFAALATPTIMGAIRRHYRDRGWAIRVPRRVHEITVAARRVEEELTVSLGRAPQVEEVAERLRISVDELLEVQDAVHCRSTASIDEHTGPDGHDDGHGGIDLGERDAQLGRVDDRVDLRRALGLLDEREREVVRRYFFEEQSQSEIGRHFGVSQMQVSRWLSSIVRRLRVQVAEGPTER